jgi:RNA-binding protein
VTSAIDQGLETHELIKVKVGSNGSEDIAELGERIQASTRSHLCDVIGRTLLLYRRRSKEPTIVLPRARSKKAPGGDSE